MAERQRYKFLFRVDGEPVMVVHDTRPGDAENCARKMARIIAKKEHAAEVACIWKGPEDEKIPEKIREEIRKEKTT